MNKLVAIADPATSAQRGEENNDFPTADEFWKNLGDYRLPVLPFVDAYSRFGIGFDARVLGPGFLYPRATVPGNNDGHHFIHPLLHLWIEEDDQPAAVPRSTMVSWPWAAEEQASFWSEAGLVKIEATHVFADERTLLTEFRFQAIGKDQVIRPYWSGCLHIDRVDPESIRFFQDAATTPRIPFIETNDEAGWLWMGWRKPEGPSDLPQAGCLLEWDHETFRASVRQSAFGRNSLETDSITQPVYYRIGPANGLHLSADQTVSVTMRLTFEQEFADRILNRPSPEFAPAPASNWSDTARSRFLKESGLEKQAEKPPASISDRKIREARFHLMRNGIQGGNGRWADQRANLCSASRNFSTMFFWDALFTSVALASFNKDYARETLDAVFAGMDPVDGATPERSYNFHTGRHTLIHSPQSPIAAWALCEYLRIHEDRPFAARFYPVLCRNHDYWKDYCDADQDGLSEYRWSGQVADDSPLWDCVAVDLKAGFNWLPPVASVALNSFLYKDATHLSTVAQYLGLNEEAARWSKRAEFIADRINEVCFAEDEKRYWDYNQLTRSHRRIKTFYMFWPLYAGLPVSTETRRDLIENVLLDPDQFFGEIPFPSVAYDEPEYDPKGYWRGRSWPHISYWLLETLWKNGYHAEADEAASRLIARESEISVFTENTVTNPSLYECDGFRGYNWSSAAALLIHSRHYRDSIKLI